MRFHVLDEPSLERAALDIAELLAHHGLIGPLNFNGRETDEGEWQFFELNARATGLCAVRAALGFDQFEASWRCFVEGRPCAKFLNARKDVVGTRHLAFDIITKHDLDTLAGDGVWRRHR